MIFVIYFFWVFTLLDPKSLLLLFATSGISLDYRLLGKANNAIFTSIERTFSIISIVLITIAIIIVRLRHGLTLRYVQMLLAFSFLDLEFCCLFKRFLSVCLICPRFVTFCSLLIWFAFATVTYFLHWFRTIYDKSAVLMTAQNISLLLV